ncbi:hypothetical protein ACN9MN_11020 [Chryseobacterium sp. S-02]|uniref:hypothetical protein n=1 Tax=Chryseobacterium sp. S-02 TaxID=3404064 RepID=UPI003CF61070
MFFRFDFVNSDEIGGAVTNDTWSNAICNSDTNCADYHYYKDGVVVGGGDLNEDCEIQPINP